MKVSGRINFVYLSIIEMSGVQNIFLGATHVSIPQNVLLFHCIFKFGHFWKVK